MIKKKNCYRICPVGALVTQTEWRFRQYVNGMYKVCGTKYKAVGENPYFGKLNVSLIKEKLKSLHLFFKFYFNFLGKAVEFNQRKTIIMLDN